MLSYRAILLLWEFSFREKETGVLDLFRLTCGPSDKRKKHVMSGVTVSTTIATHEYLSTAAWLVGVWSCVRH